MKRILLALGILAVVLPGIRQAAAADVSIDFFYDNLGDDGSWVEVGDYGYCWQPNVAATNPNWRPYADGYWAYTDVGWTWVSNEDFGWATYHYGRWARLRDTGWVWVPGREWGPAWVSWRTGGDYVGWAPLPPQRVADGEVVYEGRPITNRVDIDFDIGPAYYNFVNVRYIGDPVLRERILQPEENVTYINRTVNVTNITYNDSRVYNHGPDFDRLNRFSTRKIQRLDLERENNVDLSAAVHSRGVTKVQGNKLMIAAPLTFAKPAKAITPKAVKTRIEKPTLEHGWSGIKNPKEKAELEAKIKKEDPKKVPAADIQPASGTGAPPAPVAGVAPNESNPAPTVTPAPQASVMPARANEHGKRGNRPPGTTPAVSPNESKPAGPAGRFAQPSPAEEAGTPMPQATPLSEGRGARAKERRSVAPMATAVPATAPADEAMKEHSAPERNAHRANNPNAQSPQPPTTPPAHAAPGVAHEQIPARNHPPVGNANEAQHGHGKPEKEKKEKPEQDAASGPQR